MKTIRVVAAVIKAVNKNGDPVVFATQRGYGDFKDGWEFPGGKIEEGETPQAALKREIREELDTEISVGELIDTIEYDYPTFHLSMDCFWCEILKGDLILKEHEAARWLDKKSIEDVDWLQADVILIEKVKKRIKKRRNRKCHYGQWGISIWLLQWTSLWRFLTRYGKIMKRKSGSM